MFGFGGSRKTLSTYVVSMPGSEWAGLPLLQAQETAAKGLQSLQPQQRQMMVALYQSAKDRYKDCPRVKLSYVSEVYYSRHLTLSYGETKSAALMGQASLYIPPDSARAVVSQSLTKTTQGTDGDTSKQGGGNQSGGSGAGAGNDTLDVTVSGDIQSRMDEAKAASQLGAPGARIAHSSASGTSVSFNYVFTQPVAVGAVLVDLIVTEDSESGKPSLSTGYPAPPVGHDVAVNDNAIPVHNAPGWLTIHKRMLLGEVTSAQVDNLLGGGVKSVYVAPVKKQACGETDFTCMASETSRLVREGTIRGGFVAGLNGGDILVVDRGDPNVPVASYKISFSLKEDFQNRKVTYSCSATASIVGNGVNKVATTSATKSVNLQEAERVERGKPSAADVFRGQCARQVGAALRQTLIVAKK